MKKVTIKILLLFSMMILASCGTELPDNLKNTTVSEGDQSLVNIVLQLNKNNLSFTSSEGNDSFTITSNTSWTITSDQSWCTVSSSSGSGNATITINVQENSSLDSRSATITVMAGNITQTISVSQANAVYQSVRTFTVNGVSFKMKLVEGGTFTMGATREQNSASYDEYPTHEVTLSTYYIGETEVTQELWLAVMGSDYSYYKGLQKPVDAATWDECQDFIARVNVLMGMNFRLPTEAEWEFASRGGKYSQGYKFAGSNNIDEVAWYEGKPEDGPKDVAQKLPNELGLYDMSGNVEEWCQDWYGEYSSNSQTNPIGPSSGDKRVMRGGMWYDEDMRSCRTSCRHWMFPDAALLGVGLRLAL